MTVLYRNIESSGGTTVLRDREFDAKNESHPVASIQVINTLEQFASLRESWDTLVSQVPSTIYQSFDWQYYWWKHFGNECHRTLNILVIRIDDVVSGVIPLFLEQKTILGYGAQTLLRFLGCDVRSSHSRGLFDRYCPSDFLDGIVKPEDAQRVVREFLNYLQNNYELWDEVELDNIPDESVFKRELLSLLDHEKFPYAASVADVCPRLKTPTSMKEYLGSLSSGVRRRFSQARKLENGTGVSTLETISTYPEIKNSFNELMGLHQSRWNKLGYPGVFSDSRFVNFQEDVIRAFHNQGWLWFKTVRMDGNCTAARLGFNYKDIMYDYLSGFDDQQSSSKYRPGLALLLSMIEDASQSGCESIEFLRGNEQYKYELTSVQTTIWHIRLLNPTAAKSLKSVLAKFVNVYEWIRYRLFLESSTLQVQYRQSHSPLFLVRYIQFRLKRIFKTKG
ncbi:MAG: GNAT family N-acetyltransferase [Bacteroidota bacterium]